MKLEHKPIWKWLVLVVVAALMLVAAACGAAPAAQPTAPAAEEAKPEAPPEEVTITHWASAGTLFECQKKVVADTFNAKNLGVKLDFVGKEDVVEVVRTALQAGTAPDVVPTHGPSYVAEIALAEQVLPLDPYVEKFGWDKKFFPWALDIGSVKGTLYSLPQELETVVLYYNKTLFEEKGWEPPQTIDELVTLAEKIQKEGVTPFAGQAGECKACNEWYFGQFVNHVAGPDKVYEALTGQRDWTDPAFVEAITLLNDMMQKGYWMGSVDRFLAATFDEYYSLFASGQAAMNMEGTWFYGAVGDYFGEAVGNPREWDWVPFPSKAGEAMFNVGLGGTLSIAKTAKNPDAAALYLDHFFSPEVQGQRFVQCGLAVGPISLSGDALKGADPRMIELFEEFSRANVEGRYGYTTWTFWPPKSDVYIYEEIEKVWVGQTTPEEYLAGLEKIFQQEFDEGVVPPIPPR